MPFPKSAYDGDDDEKSLDVVKRQADLDGAFSGYGGYCPEGIPVEQAIFGILAAFAASFAFLFMAVTMITDPRRRRKKRAELGDDEISTGDIAADFSWLGTCPNVYNLRAFCSTYSA